MSALGDEKVELLLQSIQLAAVGMILAVFTQSACGSKSHIARDSQANGLDLPKNYEVDHDQGTPIKADNAQAEETNRPPS